MKKPKNLIRTTAKEDAEINRGIARDPDNPEITGIDKLVRVQKVLPDLVKNPPRRRGPNKAPTKEKVSIRLSQEVLDHYRNQGPGWQKKIDETLKESIGIK
jgi:uncharacterized protein (DUF4415 family)